MNFASNVRFWVRTASVQSQARIRRGKFPKGSLVSPLERSQYRDGVREITCSALQKAVGRTMNPGGLRPPLDHAVGDSEPGQGTGDTVGHPQVNSGLRSCWTLNSRTNIPEPSYESQADIKIMRKNFPK